MFPLQLVYTFQPWVPRVASFFTDKCIDKNSQIFRTVEYIQIIQKAAEATVLLTFESDATFI